MFLRSVQRTIVHPLNIVALVAVMSFAVAGACSATDDSELDQGGTGANSSGSATAQGGGILTSSGGNGSGGSCAGTSITAQEIPLDMYIMLDQSGSMSGNKWTSVVSALTTFVQQPDANGIGVGIQYFPGSQSSNCPPFCTTNADCGACGPCTVIMSFGICTGGGAACAVPGYATPDVPIQPLPGVASAIIGSMGAQTPDGSTTPTSAALEGAIQYATTFNNANPDHAVVTVLATDGDPNDCDSDINNIAAIAAAGVSGNPSILTFVIGVGSSLANLNAIAAGGGTGSAFLVDTNMNVQQQFLDALNVIKGQALGCTYSIPVPTSGDPDFNTVNVEYTPGDGSGPVTIPKVNSAATCPPDGFAWYYDDNANPTKILLCAGACGTVSADDMGTIDIVLGCATKVL